MLNRLSFGLVSALLASIGCPPVHASYDPSRVDVVVTATMQVVNSKQSFQGVRDVQLSLTKRSGEARLTGLNLQFFASAVTGEVVQYVPYEQKLEVLQVNQDECGSTVYVARLPQGPLGREGRRFSVVLFDHATRFCQDKRPVRWEASVRSGFGWCGTMDSTMELQGEPQPVMSILAH